MHAESQQGLEEAPQRDVSRGHPSSVHSDSIQSQAQSGFPVSAFTGDTVSESMIADLLSRLSQELAVWSRGPVSQAGVSVFTSGRVYDTAFFTYERRFQLQRQQQVKWTTFAKNPWHTRQGAYMSFLMPLTFHVAFMLCFCFFYRLKKKHQFD